MFAMTMRKARTIRRVLTVAFTAAIVGAVALPDVWGGLSAFLALGVGAALFWRHRRQVRAPWRLEYEKQAQAISLGGFMFFGGVMLAAAAVAAINAG